MTERPSEPLGGATVAVALVDRHRPTRHGPPAWPPGGSGPAGWTPALSWGRARTVRSRSIPAEPIPATPAAVRRARAPRRRRRGRSPARVGAGADRHGPVRDRRAGHRGDHGDVRVRIARPAALAEPQSPCSPRSASLSGWPASRSMPVGRRARSPAPRADQASDARLAAVTAAQPSGVVQVAQHADDLDRATEFYTQTLGLPLIARFGPLVFVDLGGTRLLLEQAAPPAMIYLRVADLQERIGQLRDAGVDVVAEPHVIFTDTDGVFGPRRASRMAGLRPGQRGQPARTGRAPGRRRGLSPDIGRAAHTVSANRPVSAPWPAGRTPASPGSGSGRAAPRRRRPPAGPRR